MYFVTSSYLHSATSAPINWVGFLSVNAGLHTLTCKQILLLYSIKMLFYHCECIFLIKSKSPILSSFLPQACYMMCDFQPSPRWRITMATDSLGSKTLVFCRAVRGSRMAVVTVSQPKIACDKHLTVSEIRDDGITAWILTDPRQLRLIGEADEVIFLHRDSVFIVQLSRGELHTNPIHVVPCRLLWTGKIVNIAQCVASFPHKENVHSLTTR